MPPFNNIRNVLRTLASNQPATIRSLEDAFSNLPSDVGRLNALLSERICDNTGGTALHVAVQQSNATLVETLMSFDPPTNIINRMQQTPLQLAQAQAAISTNTLAQKLQFKKIAALISSRARWQQADHVAHLSINRTMQLIGAAMTNQARPIELPLVALHGITQGGKTTLLNYMAGVTYTLPPGAIHPVRTGGNEEIGAVGDGVGSTTLYPTVWPAHSRNFVIADLPGFIDGRGGEKAICVAAARRLLLRNLGGGGIKSVVLVSPYNEVVAGAAGAFLTYRDATSKLGQMLNTPQQPNNLLLVLTKVPGNFDLQVVSANLQRLQIEIQQELRGYAPGHPEHDKRTAMLLTTNIILSNPEHHIIPADIFDTHQIAGTTRQRILERIDSFQSRPIDHFNFTNDDSQEMRNLTILMQRMVAEYHQLKNRYEGNLSALTRVNNEITAEQAALNTLTHLTADELASMQAKLEVCIQLADREIAELTQKQTANTRRLAGAEPHADERVLSWTQNDLPTDSLSYALRNPPRSTQLSWLQKLTSAPELVRYNEARSKIEEIMKRDNITDQAAVIQLEGMERDHLRVKRIMALPQEVHAISHFAITELQNCYEVLIGEMDGEIFRPFPFQRLSDSHPEGLVTQYADVRDNENYREAARKGSICFRIIGSLNCVGNVCCKITYSGLKRPSGQEQLQLESENIQYKAEIDAETLVRQRRITALNRVTRNAPLIEQHNATLVRLNNNRTVLAENLEEAQLELVVNQAFFTRIQNVINACGLRGQELDSFSNEDFNQASWQQTIPAQPTLVNATTLFSRTAPDQRQNIPQPTGVIDNSLRPTPM